MLETIIIIGSSLILNFFFLMGICYLIILILSVPAIKSFFEHEQYTNIHRLAAFNLHLNYANEAELPPVTVSIPVYNKNPLSIDSVKAVLNSTYKNLEVFIVNDASTDDIVDIYNKEFDFIPLPVIIKNKLPTKKVKAVYISNKFSNLYLIDKESGGVGDNHNVSINMSSSRFFITCDSDSVMEPHSISNLVISILSDSNCVAAGGAVFIANGCIFEGGVLKTAKMPDTYVGRLQVNEYVRGHLFSRTGWNALGGSLSYSGTATIFEKQSLIDVGGFDTGNYAQDAEIIMKLQQHADDNNLKSTTIFNPATAVWTYVPATLKAYIIQRDHWHRGLLKSFMPYFFKVLKTGNIKNILRYFLFIILEIYLL